MAALHKVNDGCVAQSKLQIYQMVVAICPPADFCWFCFIQKLHNRRTLRGTNMNTLTQDMDSVCGLLRLEFPTLLYDMHVSVATQTLFIRLRREQGCLVPR